MPEHVPHATVHMLAAERTAAMAQASLLDRMRYRPQQWSTRGNWKTYPADTGERWHGFESVRNVSGVSPEILFVPWPGHTMGHAGVAIEKNGGNWLLQAGDADFYHAEMDLERPRRTPASRRAAGDCIDPSPHAKLLAADRVQLRVDRRCAVKTRRRIGRRPWL